MADTPPPQSPLSYNAHQPPSLSSIASIHGNDPRGPSSRRSSLLLKSDATPLDVGHEDPGLSLHLGFELTLDRLWIDFGLTLGRAVEFGLVAEGIVGHRGAGTRLRPVEESQQGFRHWMSSHD